MNSVVGVGQSPQYQRPDPVKQSLEDIKQGKQDEVRVAKRDDNVEATKELREQAKAPVVKGQGEFVDIEA